MAQFPPSTRTRSTAALVFTRHDPQTRLPGWDGVASGGRKDAPTKHPAPQPPEPQWSRAFAVASGVLLSLLVAGIWALLLFGDSLKR